MEHMQKAGIDWPILSLHWGSNWAQTPALYFMHLAHAAIDMGYALLYGYSAHIFQDIENYRGHPILYSAGDLVDDYFVDPAYHHNEQLLFELVMQESRLMEVRLHPVFIANCHTAPATGDAVEAIVQRAAGRYASLGIRVQLSQGPKPSCSTRQKRFLTLQQGCSPAVTARGMVLPRCAPRRKGTKRPPCRVQPHHQGEQSRTILALTNGIPTFPPQEIC